MSLNVKQSLSGTIAGKQTLSGEISDKQEIVGRVSVGRPLAVVELSEVEGGHKITVTDPNGVQEMVIPDGKDGYTPQKNIDYFDGKDGYTPVVTAATIAGGYRIVITNEEESRTINLYHGENGYTPKKGKDYFTADEIEGFIASVYNSGTLSSSADVNDTNIEPGIYLMADCKAENLPKSGLYGVFIQFAGAYKPQMIVGGGAGAGTVYTRRFLSASSTWTDWKTMGNDSEIPTKLSQLQNDVGFLTSYTEKDPTVPPWAKQSTKPKYTASEVGADTLGTAAAVMSGHNTNTTAHNDIRLLVQGLTTRLNAIANSDDVDLDQLAEIVTYIKSNRTLIESVTTNKVNVSDIINNLTTSATNKPLSAKQGVVLSNRLDNLRALVEAINVPTKLSELTEDTTHRTVTDTEKETWDAKQPAGNYALKSEIPTNYAKSDHTHDEFSQLSEEVADLKHPVAVSNKSQCTDTDKWYSLPDGYIYTYQTVQKEVRGYTNHIEESIATDGSVFNDGVGYKTSYRLNSSGNEAEVTTATSVVSGHIPYSAGDGDVEIRVPNTDIYANGTNYLHVYNSAFTTIQKNASGETIDGSYRLLREWVTYYGATVENEGDTLKITIPSASLAINGVAFLRVSARVDGVLNGDRFAVAIGESITDEKSMQEVEEWTPTFLSGQFAERFETVENLTTTHETRIETLEKNSNGNITVPAYWVEELETKANDIQVAMEKAGRNKSAFLWYTDAHWVNGNSKISPMLLHYLYMNTPMNKTKFGGDIIGDTLLSTRDEMKYLYEWRKAIKALLDHHSVPGNHDRFDISSVEYEDDNYRYAFLLAPEETPDMVMGDGLYYYIDTPAEKTRYLHLDYLTSSQTAMMAHGQFIVDAIKSVPEGWHIVAIAHRWWQYSNSSTPTTGGIPPYEGEILSIFDAYNARATRSASNYFYAQDFTDGKGKVEFCIGGHIHVDYDFYTAGGIPVIITTADANQNRVPDSTVDSGAFGTITEAAVFGIIADYNEEKTKITVVGVGRGTSRVVRQSAATPTSITGISYSGDTTVGVTIDKSKFSFTVNYSDGTTDSVSGASSVSPATIAVVGNNTVTVSYTEGGTTLTGTVTIVGTAKPIANLFDKNDPDVVLRARINSSKVPVAYADGQLVTGWIEAASGDTFTIESDKANNANNYTGAVYGWKEDKATYIAQITNQWAEPYMIASDDWKKVTFKLHTNTYNNQKFTEVAYVRFCIAYTDIDSIVITKN